MTPEILVGNDALANKGASVFPAANDWVKMDQITCAVQQRIYATSILAAQAAPRRVPAHPEDVLLAPRRIRKRERTFLENACVCVSCLGARARARHRRTQALKPCLTSSGRALVFSV